MRDYPSQTTELAPGVFAYIQEGGGFCVANAGIIAAPGGTTVIDALFTPAMTRALLDETARVSPAPITRLLNTHHHVDHTLGNALFPPSAQVVAHARARAEMERVGLGVLGLVTRIAPHFQPEVEGVRERLPDTTFDGDVLELTLGDRRVRLLHFGTAHTRGDALVHLPDDRILFTGDLGFFGVTPLAFEGHIGNWLRIGDRVLDEIDAALLVPGHGPVGTRDDLRSMLRYLRLVYDGARRAFDAGASEQEATAAIELGEYAGWGDPERLPLNITRCYQEFRGELEET